MRKDDKPYLWLGKYLSLSLTLPSSAFAGVIVGSLLNRYLHWPLALPVCIVAGVMSGLIHIVKELARDENK